MGVGKDAVQARRQPRELGCLGESSGFSTAEDTAADEQKLVLFNSYLVGSRRPGVRLTFLG